MLRPIGMDDESDLKKSRLSLRRYDDIYAHIQINYRGCPRGAMVKAMDCGVVVREFVLQLRYYVHFSTNTLGKGTNPLILPAMG